MVEYVCWLFDAAKNDDEQVLKSPLLYPLLGRYIFILLKGNIVTIYMPVEDTFLFILRKYSLRCVREAFIYVLADFVR